MIEHAASEKEMMELGRQCGAKAGSGSVWWLNGELGAGKTHWTKGFVDGVGSPAQVTSPTFGLIHEYPGGKLPVFHFDFYRLNSPEELLAMGWDEYLERDGILVVEWGDKFPDLMPAGATEIRITTLGDGRREVAISDGTD